MRIGRLDGLIQNLAAPMVARKGGLKAAPHQKGSLEHSLRKAVNTA